MLTVSLHGIRIHALHGLYTEEKFLANEFEIDVDVFIPVGNAKAWPYVDYTLIHGIVANVFKQEGQLLETFVQHIHAAIKMNVPEAEKVRVAVKKMHPPMPGDVGYARVQYEN
jgi:7,8-dihydroneopterin aldolase/epimerase/oxygenase